MHPSLLCSKERKSCLLKQAKTLKSGRQTDRQRWRSDPNQSDCLWRWCKKRNKCQTIPPILSLNFVYFTLAEIQVIPTYWRSILLEQLRRFCGLTLTAGRNRVPEENPPDDPHTISLSNARNQTLIRGQSFQPLGQPDSYKIKFCHCTTTYPNHLEEDVKGNISLIQRGTRCHWM